MGAPSLATVVINYCSGFTQLAARFGGTLGKSAHNLAAAANCRRGPGWLALLLSITFVPPSNGAEPVARDKQTPASAPVRPAERVVVSAETKEQQAIEKEALELLLAKQYAQLDDLGRKHRGSMATYANGRWKLQSVYQGLYSTESDQPEADQKWMARLNELQAWSKARPESVLAQVATAEQWINFAWKARGRGFADRVTESGWRDFHERLTQAKAVLQPASALREKCPHWHLAWLRLAQGLGTGKREFIDSFEQAVRFEPAYFSYYSATAVYLLPRWVGDEGEMERFVSSRAERLDPDEGSILYTRLVWSLHSLRLYSTNIFKQTAFSWQRADKGFALLEKRFPDSLAVLSERAYLTALGGTRQAARRRFDRLQGQVDLSVWRTPSAYGKQADRAYGQPKSVPPPE